MLYENRLEIWNGRERQLCQNAAVGAPFSAQSHPIHLHARHFPTVLRRWTRHFVATTGIVNILHTFARTKHGTCTPASSFLIIWRVFLNIFFFLIWKADFDAACKLQFTMCAPGSNLEADLHSCPGGAVAKILTGAAQAQGMLQGLAVKLLPKWCLQVVSDM